MDINNSQHWEEVLKNLATPDTTTVRNATKILEECMKESSSFLMLFKLITSSSDPIVNHMASILCRRSVNKHWDLTSKNYQDEIKQYSFQIIIDQSTPRVIRKSMADIIVKIINKTTEWNGFFDNIIKLASSNDIIHKEIGIYLIQNLLEYDNIRNLLIYPNINTVLQLISNGLQDNNQDVRISTLSCANSFLYCLESDNIILDYIKLLPYIIKVIHYSIEDSDDRVSVGFEILSTLTEDYMSFLKPYVADLLKFALTIGSNQSLDISFRNHALFFIEFTISNKPKSFLENINVIDVIKLAFIILTEPEEDDEISIRKNGSQIIDVLAIEIPSKYIWKPIMECISHYIKSSRSVDRRAAIIAITVITEGLADKIVETIDQIMPFIINGLQDDNEVRQASIIAVSEFAKTLAGVLDPYHDTIIPLILQSTKDSIDDIAIKSYYCLIHYISGEPSAFLPYLEILIEHLLNGISHNHMLIKEYALNALSATITIAKSKFDPYLPKILPLMKEWMKLNDPNSYKIRCKATECISMISAASSPQLFMPHFNDIMTTCLDSLENVDDPEVREYIYRYFEQLVRNSMCKELCPYYPIILPYLLASSESGEGIICLKDNEPGLQLFEESLDTFENQQVSFKILESYMEEKMAAISCLGWFICEDHEASASYIESAYNLIAGLTLFDLYPPVACNANVALVQILTGILHLFDETYEWKKGELSQIPEQVMNAVLTLYSQFEKVMKINEQSMVRGAIEAIGKLTLTFGPSSIINQMPVVSQWMQDILNRKAYYQLNRESLEENDEDFVTFTMVLDVMVEFSKSCGKLFVPFLPDLFNCISPYLSPDAPSEYQECCMSMITDVAKEIKNDFEYFGEFLPICLQNLKSDNEDSTIQYACACIRQILLYSKLPNNSITSIWQVVNQLLNVDNSRSLLFDSLYGLMASLVLLYPDIHPITHIPQALVQALPLRVDAEPSTVIYECIFKYLNASQPEIMNILPQVIELFIREITIGDITEEVKQQQIHFLQKLKANNQIQVIDNAFNNILQKQQVPQNLLQQLRNIL